MKTPIILSLFLAALTGCNLNPMKSPALTPDEIAVIAAAKDERAGAEALAIVRAAEELAQSERPVPKCGNCGAQEWRVTLVGLGQEVECTRCGEATPIGEWEEEHGTTLTPNP